MANKFRENCPVRTCTKTYARYGSYKDHLARDFNHKCGYTDCYDFWFGGKNNFHIDHFIPWKNYPTKPGLKTDYQNLVYCCSYVNILKSNDETNYIDPCNTDFNDHFIRDNVGNILPVETSPAANYMYKKLKLFLKRYQLIWMLEKIKDKIEAIDLAIKKNKNPELENDLLIAAGKLSLEMNKYISYLQKNQ